MRRLLKFLLNYLQPQNIFNLLKTYKTIRQAGNHNPPNSLFKRLIYLKQYFVHLYHKVGRDVLKYQIFNLKQKPIVVALKNSEQSIKNKFYE